MGEVNVCVKRSYIAVASLMAIISAVLLAATLFSHGYLHETEEIENNLKGLLLMYAVTIITLLLPIIGVYGTSKGKNWALIVFTVGMIPCILFMMDYERRGLTMREKAAEDLKQSYLYLLPLSNTSQRLIESIEYTQTELQCCGVHQGYQDWGYDIPESCLCVEGARNPCVAAPKDSNLFEHQETDQPVMIYKESCLPFVISHVLTGINVIVGLTFGLTLIWIFAEVLCIIMLYQLRQNNDFLTVFYSPKAKNDNYAILTETEQHT